MKGKKINHQFVTDFINKCTENNQLSIDEIINLAQSSISNVNKEIEKIQELKILRNNLLDVIFVLGEKQSKDKDKNKLKFLMIDKVIGKYICSNFDNSDFNPVGENITFTLKQLVLNNILKIDKDKITEGELYSEYIKYLWKL